MEGPVTVAFPGNSDRFEAAHKVLRTPELLEAILSCLSPTDLLSIRAVSRVFYNEIDSSPTICKAMFRQPNDTALPPQLPPYKIRGVESRFGNDRGRTTLVLYLDGDGLGPDVDCLGESSYLQTSSFLRKLFIAQPPPTHATIETLCLRCYTAKKETVKHFRASQERLTFGDLVHAARLHGTCQGTHETRGWKITADMGNFNDVELETDSEVDAWFNRLNMRISRVAPARIGPGLRSSYPPTW